MILRPYQQQAVEAVYQHLRVRNDNPCVVIPTAGGKTPIMATICHDAATRWQGRVLVVAHAKELLTQTARTLREISPDLDVGVYSAGLGQRNTSAHVIVAGIQSVHRRACDLGPFQMILVDEAHLIPTEGDGMYRRFLADASVVNPDVRLVGFTATPYRLKEGPICTPEGLLNHICFEIPIPELIGDGFLSPLISTAAHVQFDTSQVRICGGDFHGQHLEELMDRDDLVRAACAELVAHTPCRQACLLFAAGIDHARHIAAILQQEHGLECRVVTSETSVAEREDTLARFRAGQLKYLANVNVLTTGFDAPHIDCVALLRPTLSPGLYYQMVGRGFRLHPGKDNCLVLDFGGNVLRHGPVDRLRIPSPAAGEGEAPQKPCPACQEMVAAGCASCPHCGYLFPPPERQLHEARASTLPVLERSVTTTTYRVHSVRFRVHHKKGAPRSHPKSLQVEYQCGKAGSKSEWICFEHAGYARERAVAWWKQRSQEPPPSTAAQAVALIRQGAIASTHSIVTHRLAGKPFETICDYQLGPIPRRFLALPSGLIFTKESHN